MPVLSLDMMMTVNFVACPTLSLMLFLPFIKVPVPSELYCLHLFLDILFHSHIIISVKIVVFWVMTVRSVICGWIALLAELSAGGSRLCKMLVTTYSINGATV
jgi:hypothetical protein